MPLFRDSADPADIFRPRFERCFRDHYASLLAFAIRRTPGREAAEDAVSETFAVAWRRRDLIPASAAPWLYAIAIKVIANQRRSSQRRRALDERLALEADVMPPAHDPAGSLSRREAFAAAFERLGEPEREALRLLAWDGLDTREAARVLGCSPGAFRVRVHRARRKLAKHLRAAGHPTQQQTALTSPAEEAN